MQEWLAKLNIIYKKVINPMENEVDKVRGIKIPGWWVANYIGIP